MRRIVASLVLMLCFVAFTAAQESVPDNWYYDKPVKNITFEGLANISAMELSGITSPFLNQPFTDDLYVTLLERLYALEFFSEINPSALPADPAYETVNLRFTVKELPIVSSIKVSGNSAIRRSEVLGAITIKERDIYNNLKVRVDERAIRELYLQKGYTNIRVSSVTAETSGGIEVEFIVNEGGQTVVSLINFEGNTVVASKTLKDQLSLKEAGLFNKGAFRETMLETDKAQLLKYYWNNGYIKAAVTNVIRTEDIESEPGKTKLTLTFIINEGGQYTYGGTTFSGNDLFSSEELGAKIRLNVGDVFNMTRYEEGQMAASDLYYENGYTSNMITREDIVDEENRTISFVINIVERPRSHIERIVIRGNTKTREEVILRELNLESGDIFSRNKFMTGMRNLYNLQFFSSIVPDMAQGSEENLVDMIIDVEEGNTTAIEFGVTFTGNADAESLPVSLFLKFQDNNLMGTGQALSATGNLSFDEQSFEATYAHRYLFNLPLTVNFSLGVSHTTNFTEQVMYLPPAINTADYQMTYEQLDFQLGIGTGYRWLPNFAMVTLSGGFTFGLLQNFYDKTLYVPSDYTIRDSHGKWNPNNTVWTSIALDNRDVYYDPSKGWFFKQRIGWTGLFPTIENEYFLRADTKVEGYLTLLDIPFTENWSLKFVLAAYSGLSAIAPLHIGGKPMISEKNLLYIDGMFNGRGWNYASGSLSYQKRGNAMWSNWVELRIPVVPNIFAIDFFFDAVAVKENMGALFTNLGIEDFYFSFGPGFRVSIPQFPLRLMLANTFKVENGNVVWGTNGKATGPDWKVTLSFNLANQ